MAAKTTGKRSSLRRSLVAVAAILCVAVPATASTGLKSSKGWELYSWKDGEDWRFALAFGTNRTKFCTELKNPKSIRTLTEVEANLRDLSEGEYVFWLADVHQGSCGLSYPPASTIERIRQLCRRLGLRESDAFEPRPKE